MNMPSVKTGMQNVLARAKQPPHFSGHSVSV
jgi:hypothetical protein